MKVTAAQFRQNVYAILDEVIEKGEPVEIVRKGKVLKIVPDQKPSKFDNLKKRETWVGDPDDIFKIDWSKEWREPALLDVEARRARSRKK
jgi:antitoxin (DNA-binding transcriptional repressor) of toxin-antitoxin stability system